MSLPTSGSIQKQDKQAIVLSDTIKSALTGDPEIVLVQAKADYDDQLTLSKNNREVLTEIGVSDLALTRYTPLSLAFDLDSNSERGFGHHAHTMPIISCRYLSMPNPTVYQIRPISLSVVLVLMRCVPQS